MMPRVFSVAEQFDDTLIPLDPEQALRLRHFDLPPVKYEDLSHYGDGDATVSGFCPRFPLMPHLGGGEVVIDLGIARGTTYERARRRRIAIIYIHELAHRLVPSESHGPVFAAVCAALTLRALPHEISIGWYEVQDAENPGAALNHAIEFGRVHKESNVNAKDLPQLAKQSWNSWRDEAWKDLLAQANSRAQSDIDSANSREAAARATVLAQALELFESFSAVSQEKARADRLACELTKVRNAAERDLTMSWDHIAAVGFVCVFVGALIGFALAR